ncbi:MAG: translocation/assembly module TamB domain-containing protein [Gammaproteobacteria bacterium]
MKRRIALAAVAITFVVAGVVLALVGTEPGTRWLLGAGLRTVPGTASVAAVSGTLAGTVTMRDLHLRTEAFALQAATVTLRLRLRDLFARAVHLERLHLADATLDLPARPSQPTPDLRPPPVRIAVDRARVDRLRVLRAGHSEAIVVQRATVAFEIGRDGQVRIPSLEVAGASGSLGAHGTALLAAAPSARLQIAWNYGAAAAPVAAGSGSLELQAGRLVVRQRTRVPLVADLEGHADIAGQAWTAVLRTAGAQPLPAALSDMAESLDGRIDLAGTGTGMTGRMEIRTTGAALDAVRIQAHVGGDIRGQMALHSLELRGPGSTRIHAAGTIANLDRQPALDLSGGWQDLGWPLSSGSAAKSAHGQWSLQGTLDDYRLNASAATVRPEPLAGTWRLQAHGDRGSLTVQSLDAAIGDGGLSASGTLGWNPAARASLNVRWHDLVLAAAARPPLRSPKGSAHLTLEGRDLHAGTRMDLQAEGWPRGEATATLVRDGSAFVVDAARLRIGSGAVDASGRFDPGLAGRPWNAAISTRGFNPAVFDARWPGSVDLDAVVQGNGADFSARLRRAAGELRGQALSAAASVSRHGGRYRVESLDARLGRSMLAIAPAAGAPTAQAWKISVPDLAAALPGAAGTLEGSGRLQRDGAGIALGGVLRATGLHTGGYALAHLDADVDLRERGPVRARVSMRNLRARGRTVETLDLDLDGRTEAHRLSLSAAIADSRVDLRFQGAWGNARTWSGELRGGEIRSPIGRFALIEPAGLRIGATTVELSTSCWRDEAAEICAGGRGERDANWSAQVTASALSPARLPLAPIHLDGPISGRLSARGSGASIAALEGAFSSAPGTLRVEIRPDESWALAYRGIDARIDSSQSQATMTLGMLTGSGDRAQLTAITPLSALGTQAFADMPLQARAELSVEDSAAYASLVPDIELGAGRLHADLRVEGTPAQMQWRGYAALAIESASLLDLGIRLQDLDLHLQGDGGGDLRLHGALRSGPGTLRLDGVLTPAAARAWSGRVQVHGENVQAVNLPELQATVSPDITLDIAGRAATVTGTVDVPKARIAPRRLATRIAPSEDAIILVDGAPAAAPREPMLLNSDVRIRLGEDVRFDVRGFSGRLGGELRAVDEPHKPTTGTGEIRVMDGEFSAYGRKFALQSGRLSFAGGPIDDPSIQARAERRIGDVTVAVQAAGRARDPSITLASTPRLPDAEILSYLVLGRSLRQTTGADGRALLGAATSLGLSGANRITRQVATALHLDELSVDRDATTRSMTLNVGKYLSPRLYIGYALGVLDRTNTVRLRYDVTPHWSVEAEQGAGSGADVLYNIER